MANYNQPTRTTVVGGIKTVKNYGVSDIAEGLCVKPDTSNTGSNSAPMGVILTADDAKAWAVTMQIIKAGQSGEVQTLGQTWATASGTIHVGDPLMTDSAGKVLAQTAGKYQIGIAVSEAVSGDPCQFDIARAKNA
jgi:hypothetical protein